MVALFRAEAQASQQQAWLGSVQLHRPATLRWLSLLALGGVVAVGAFLFSTEYTRKARVNGLLVPERGVMRLSVPQSATVVARPVQDGQQVREGDVLFVLSLDSANPTGDSLSRTLKDREQSLGAAQAQQRELAQSQAASLKARIATLESTLRQADAELQLHAQREALAQQSLGRLESLAKDQFVSSAQVQTKREELLGLQAQRQALSRERENLQREALGLQAELQAIPLKAQVQQGELARDIAALQAQGVENEARRRLVLRAPSDGQMSTVLAEPGQVVQAGTQLAALLPARTPLQAHLYAPSSAVGFLRPHQAVLLRYQAFPYQKFGQQAGEVLQVARTPLQAAELAQLGLPAAMAQGEPMYRITVQLQRQSVEAYGQDQTLSPGMLLEADVLLERRRLIEWIFEPLLSLARRV
ncbi:HlyD family efflux transporter periplasmic adaptor subunit [Mitsuaria sp. TWR114]|uniref:HlyD family secretion protein n=1 Tax=Mitsuaria sp. TWR114 TaxID=2601731 RepID=UPI0008E6C8DA|nr:HlyD family efflux transporter periplasmic adaptor subunit [Mitsuaria sp. TWR114]TXD99774.1 HlyD family efflux transporter periplasmic adaptor subunit [Mitsuaria sp. TWR114]SFR93960.1 membrane fusion protein [Mitsuaria sp. PDC51]